MLNFENIPGNTRIKSLLLNQAARGQVSHAQLFSGPMGCANLFTALAYAKLLLCDNREATDSCGKCKSCKQFDNSGHPDFHLVIPTPAPPGNPVQPDYALHTKSANAFIEAVRKNPYLSSDEWGQLLALDNKQLLIPSNEALVLTERLSLRAYQGGNRLILIWLPELFNPTSGNKLLKLIEEPPPGAVLLFVSHAPEEILQTIISRTQAVEFKSHTVQECAAYLIATKQVSEETAFSFSTTYEGNIAAAVYGLENKERITGMTSLFARWMRTCFKGDTNEILAVSEQIGGEQKHACMDFLGHTMEILSRGVLFHTDPVFANGLTKDVVDFNFEKFTHHLNHINIPKIQELLEQAFYDVENNSNRKLTLLDCSFKLAKFIRQKPD